MLHSTRRKVVNIYCNRGIGYRDYLSLSNSNIHAFDLIFIEPFPSNPRTKSPQSPLSDVHNTHHANSPSGRYDSG